MEEVSAEKLAEEVSIELQHQEQMIMHGRVYKDTIPCRQDVDVIAKAINKATQREREVQEKLCKRLEFIDNFMKTNMEDSLSLRALLKDNQELVDQVRLER